MYISVHKLSLSLLKPHFFNEAGEIKYNNLKVIKNRIA